MFTKNELKFLEFIFEKTLEDVELFIDQVNILRLDIDSIIHDTKYKLTKSYYYISLFPSLFFFYMAAIYPFLKIFNIELFIFISFLLLIPTNFLDNKLHKLVKRIAIVTDFIQLKRKINNFKNNIDALFQYHIICEFEDISVLLNYHQLIEKKVTKFNHTLKNFIRSYVFSTFLPLFFLLSISFSFIFFLNLDYLWTSLLYHFVIFFLFLLNKILPKLLELDFFRENRLKNVIKIITKAEEDHEYPNKLIIESLDNYSFYNFSKFNKQMLCYNCLNITPIKSIDEKEIYYCIHCNHSTDIKNKIIFIESYNLQFYCIRCGYFNSKPMENPFDEKIICKNCMYESRKIEYPQLVELLVRILGKKDKIGLVFISTIPSKIQILSFSFIYYDFQLLEPILKLIPIEVKKSMLLRLPFNILKDISINGQNRYPLIKNSFKYRSYFSSSLKQIRKMKLNSNDFHLNNEIQLKKKGNLISKKTLQMMQKIEEVDTKYADTNNTIKTSLLGKLNIITNLEYQNFENFIKLIEFIIKFNIKNYEIDSLLRESADKFWKTNKKKINSKMYMEKRWFHDKLYEAFLNEFGEVVSRELDRVGGKVDFEVLKIPIETKVLNDKNYPSSSEKSGLEILRSKVPQLFQYISLTRCGLIIGYDYRQEKIKNEFKRLAPSECIFVETEETKIIFGILLVGNKEKPSDYPNKKLTNS